MIETLKISGKAKARYVGAAFRESKLSQAGGDEASKDRMQKQITHINAKVQKLKIELNDKINGLEFNLHKHVLDTEKK